MSFLDTARDYLSENLFSVLAFAMMIIIILGYVAFLAVAIIPKWQARSALEAQVNLAQESLDGISSSQASIPDILRSRIATGRERFNELVAVFMSEDQAAITIDNLYRYADLAGVEIIDLQALTPVDSVGASAYDSSTFRLTVEGFLPGLLTFVSQIQEASAPSVAIENLNISEETERQDGRSALNMDLTIYTSIHAPTSTIVQGPDTVPSTPTPLPPGPEAISLEQRLDDQWAAENWGEVIVIIEAMQTTATGAEAADLREKLYAAYVNYGFQLVRRNDLVSARTRFEQALAVNPNGSEALGGIHIVSLLPQLDQLWTNEAWPDVIRVVEQILAVTPGDAAMREKLYAAYVNYGHQLISQQRIAAARAAFQQALTINPNGAEARAGLQSLSPLDPPEVRTYVVQRGDTLFSIARRFNVSLDDLKSANGLTDNRIVVNQTLTIPP